MSVSEMPAARRKAARKPALKGPTLQEYPGRARGASVVEGITRPSSTSTA